MHPAAINQGVPALFQIVRVPVHHIDVHEAGTEEIESCSEEVLLEVGVIDLLAAVLEGIVSKQQVDLLDAQVDS